QSGPHAEFAYRNLWNVDPRAVQPYSGLMLAARITSAHLFVSSAMNVPKAAGASGVIIAPRSAKRAFSVGSASPALISLLRISTTSIGVFLGAPTPDQELTS